MVDFKTREDLETVIKDNKPESVIRNYWISVKQNDILNDFIDELKHGKDGGPREYDVLYPPFKVEEVKLGNLVVSSKTVEVKYLEYSEEKEIIVRDEYGDIVIDEETGEPLIKLEPVLPDDIFVEDENGNKELAEEYRGLPLRPAFDYYLKKKVKEFLSNEDNFKVNMEGYVDFIKPILLKKVNIEFEKAMDTITGAYPEAEQKTWDIQRQEAIVYSKDNTVKTPMIDNIAESRGVDKEVLVNKILEKANKLDIVTGKAIGYRQRAEDVISEVVTFDELVKIVEEFTADRELFYKILKN